jgi:hypothetical protein
MRMWQLMIVFFVKPAESERQQAGRWSRSCCPGPAGNASSKQKADAIRRLSIAGGPRFSANRGRMISPPY